MKREDIIERIKEYFCGAVSGAFYFGAEEMSDIMPGVFIGPCEYDDWYDRGAVIFTKDENGETDDSDVYSIEPYIDEFYELLLNGPQILNEIAEKIFDDWYED